MEKILKYISNISTLERQHRLIESLRYNNIPFTIEQNKNATNILLFPENHTPENILFTAHYDIVKNSSGANDNGSSVVILLGLAKHLMNQNHNVAIAFLDKEEYGGFGCDMYFKNHMPRLMVNLDVCGSGDNIVICNDAKTNNSFANKLYEKFIPKSIETDKLPYCDGTHAYYMGAEVFSISVFPRNDAVKMGKVRMSPRDKHIIQNKSLEKLERQYHIPVGLEIFDYMHNGKYDDIEHINFPIMYEIYQTLIEALQN